MAKNAENCCSLNRANKYPIGFIIKALNPEHDSNPQINSDNIAPIPNPTNPPRIDKIPIFLVSFLIINASKIPSNPEATIEIRIQSMYVFVVLENPLREDEYCRMLIIIAIGIPTNAPINPPLIHSFIHFS
jgi:hypothetical protein